MRVWLNRWRLSLLVLLATLVTACVSCEPKSSFVWYEWVNESPHVVVIVENGLAGTIIGPHSQVTHQGQAPYPYDPPLGVASVIEFRAHEFLPDPEGHATYRPPEGDPIRGRDGPRLIYSVAYT